MHNNVVGKCLASLKMFCVLVYGFVYIFTIISWIVIIILLMLLGNLLKDVVIKGTVKDWRTRHFFSWNTNHIRSFNCWLSESVSLVCDDPVQIITILLLLSLYIFRERTRKRIKNVLSFLENNRDKKCFHFLNLKFIQIFEKMVVCP